MTVDLRNTIGAELPVTSFSWNADNVILYHLGLNAGQAPSDPRELRYFDENGLVVSPSYAVLLALPTAVRFGYVPGMIFDRSPELHGDLDLEVCSVMPTAACGATSGRIA